jgi:hypothetical protein
VKNSGGIMDELLSKAEVLASLEREREYLLSMKMYGAEHILVKHAINIIEEMESKDEEQK